MSALHIIGNAFLMAYFALGTPGCQQNALQKTLSEPPTSVSSPLSSIQIEGTKDKIASPIPEKKTIVASLESKLKSAKLYQREGDDVVAVQMDIYNSGSSAIPPFELMYSICYAPPAKLNDTNQCVGGDFVRIEELSPSEHIEKTLETTLHLGKFSCSYKDLVAVVHLTAESLGFDRSYLLHCDTNGKLKSK
ncbi:hypothetical protein HYX13_01125 [Candidatus Woesearchaeota archaeon]|nr:hypothetical protein [Candidatus Woesearchaeota archaeon]